MVFGGTGTDGDFFWDGDEPDTDGICSDSHLFCNSNSDCTNNTCQTCPWFCNSCTGTNPTKVCELKANSPFIANGQFGSNKLVNGNVSFEYNFKSFSLVGGTLGCRKTGDHMDMRQTRFAARGTLR